MLNLARWIFAIYLMLQFFLIATWMAAEPPENFVGQDDVVIPAHWRAVVVGHGKYTEWEYGTVSESPFLFSLSVVSFLTVFVFLLWIESILKKQRAEKSS